MADSLRLPPLAATSDRPGLAAFDVDGTLSKRDTLIPFLASVAGSRRLSMGLARAIGKARRGRGEAKQELITATLAGRRPEELDPLIEAFVDRLLARGMRPETVKRVAEHRDAGHDVVLISASPDLYLRALGRRLEVTDVCSTRLAVDGNGRLTGRLDGPNCRAGVKVERLKAWLADRPGSPALEDFEIWAYGDSSGDLDLLAVADHPTWVGPNRKKPTTDLLAGP